jgi:hypothetical protein
VPHFDYNKTEPITRAWSKDPLPWTSAWINTVLLNVCIETPAWSPTGHRPLCERQEASANMGHNSPEYIIASKQVLTESTGRDPPCRCKSLKCMQSLQGPGTASQSHCNKASHVSLNIERFHVGIGRHASARLQPRCFLGVHDGLSKSPNPTKPDTAKQERSTVDTRRRGHCTHAMELVRTTEGPDNLGTITSCGQGRQNLMTSDAPFVFGGGISTASSPPTPPCR